jgi:regulator of sigma E protease
MEVIIKILQFVFALSLLIFVHEMGHFLFSRLFKIRVDKFYLFFNPSFSIVRAKRVAGRWRFRWFSAAPPKEWATTYADKTEWGIGWLPLGGYCKIAGMIDESMDKEQMKQPPQSWEFRTHPAWQRMLVMVGGVLFNFLLAILIYWGMAFTWGERYLETKNLTGGVACDSLALAMGFRHGDRIVAFDGQPVERFYDFQPNNKYRSMIQMALIRSRLGDATVVRGGDTVTIPLGEHYRSVLLKHRSPLFEPIVPFVIADVPELSPNDRSGLQAGDTVVGLDSLPLADRRNVQAALLERQSRTVVLHVRRNDSTHRVAVAVDAQGRIGVELQRFMDIFPITEKRYGLFAALPVGMAKGYDGIIDYVQDLRLMLTTKAGAQSIGSVITIVNIFPEQWNWYDFWYLSAMLTIMLAVLNILPIPALDGGHLMFVLYEIVTRRKPSEKMLEVAQWIGFLFLIALMIFAFGNDILRFMN